MKTAPLLLIIAGSCALTLGGSYAASSASLSSEADPRATHPTTLRPAGPVPGNRNQADRKPPQLSHPGEASQRTGPASLIHTPATRAPATELHQTALKRGAAAPKNAPMMSQTKNPREPFAKPTLESGIGAPLPGGIRSRGATAAGVGRVLLGNNSRASTSAGALDGAAIKRKY